MFPQKMIRYPIVSFIIFSLYLLYSISVSASELIIGESGRVAYPINTDKVKIKSMKIRINMEDNQYRRARIKSEFTYENMSHEKIVAIVGFPGKIIQPPPGDYFEDLENIVSYINGMKVDVQIENEILSLDDNYWGSPIEGERKWYKWVVTLLPQSSKTLEISYLFTLTTTQYVDLLSVLLDPKSYMIKPDMSIEKPIEKIVIELIYKSKKDLESRILYIVPDNYKIAENTIRWKFDNLMFNEDIRVIEVTKWKNDQSMFWNFIKVLNSKNYVGESRYYDEQTLNIKNNEILRGAMERDLKSHWIREIKTFVQKPTVEEFNKYYEKTKKMQYEDMQILYARLLRNEIYARHGRTFKSADLKYIFENIDWYKHNPNYSDNMLNDIERKNIQFILEYEKKKGWR